MLANESRRKKYVIVLFNRNEQRCVNVVIEMIHSYPAAANREASRVCLLKSIPSSIRATSFVHSEPLHKLKESQSLSFPSAIQEVVARLEIDPLTHTDAAVFLISVDSFSDSSFRNADYTTVLKQITQQSASGSLT